MTGGGEWARARMAVGAAVTAETAVARTGPAVLAEAAVAGEDGGRYMRRGR